MNGKEDNYPPTNRPHALSHWLEHGDVHGETIVILDPDMVMMRRWETPAQPGKPYSQRYVYSGFPWHKGIVAQRFCQRCLKMTQREIHKKYVPGAPCASMTRHSIAPHGTAQHSNKLMV